VKIVILGAGPAGRLAKKYFEHYDPIIIDKNAGIFNHNAVFRLKNKEVASMLDSNYKTINIEKQIYYKGKLFDKPSIKMKNEYSLKISKNITDRSINALSDNSERHVIEIKKDNNILNKEIYNITNGAMLDKSHTEIEYDICINTIPMPVILKLTNMGEISDGIKFKQERVYVYKIKHEHYCDVNQTIYFPDIKFSIYRATLDPEGIIIESIFEISVDDLKIACEAFGLYYKLKGSQELKQDNGKIVKIDGEQRRFIIMELTEKHNIYSLGRYATWREKVMVDDLLEDLRKIDRMITINDKRRKYESHTN
jgi:hypothetical protein